MRLRMSSSPMARAFATCVRERCLLLLLAVCLCGLSPESWGQGADLEALSRAKAHHRPPGFVNPWLSKNAAGSFWRFLKWKLSSNPYAEGKRQPPSFPVIRPVLADILSRGDSITYLGHATLWIRLQGKNILTDPVFGDIWGGITRHTPFPLEPGDLPPIEVVLISHNHYDHLDTASLRRLGTAPLYLTPLGYREWFAEVLPGARVIELDWFEVMSHQGLMYRLLPAQHWTMRSPGDINRSLWGAWLIQGPHHKVFFGGDSGYFSGFEEYGRKFGPVDVALLPIGAYEPRWFMAEQHMNPQEAMRAFRDLKARVFIPQQWGVFDLTDEPLDLPPQAFREAARAAGFSEETTPLLPHGGTWFFP